MSTTPPDIFSNFGPGTATTRTGGAPGFGAGGYGYGNFGLNTQYLNNLLGSQLAIRQARGDEEFAVKDAMAREQLKAMQQRNSMPRDDYGNLLSSPGTLDQQNLRGMQEKGKLAQLEALTGQAPKKWNEGAGIVPGYSMDPQSMTGAQRQMFLPQSSHGYPSGDPGGGFGKPLPSPIDTPYGGGSPDTSTQAPSPEQRLFQQNHGFFQYMLSRNYPQMPNRDPYAQPTPQPGKG